MRNRLAIFVLSCSLALLSPQYTFALTLPQVVGLFHVAAGLILAAIVLLFAIGFATYVARFNTWPSHRDSTIRVLEWALTMLLVYIIVLSLVNAIQRHGRIALPIIALIIIVFLGFYIVRFILSMPPSKPPAKK